MIVVRLHALTPDGDRGVCTIRLHGLAESDDDYSGVVEINGPGIDFVGPAFGTDPIQTLLTMIHFAYLQVKQFESSGGKLFVSESYADDAVYSSEVWRHTAATLFAADGDEPLCPSSPRGDS